MQQDRVPTHAGGEREMRIKCLAWPATTLCNHKVRGEEEGRRRGVKFLLIILFLKNIFQDY